MNITPGPWEATEDTDGDIYITPAVNSAGWDCEEKGLYFNIARLEFDPGVANTENQWSNARAIAAVPNFIGLLADLVAGEDIEPIKREARALLRRIEGEEEAE